MRGFKGKLNNLMIQLRKNCNHPDLLESQFDGSCMSFSIYGRYCIQWVVASLKLSNFLFWAVLFPPVEQIVAQCGKFQLLDKLVGKLLARKHKVLNVSKYMHDVLHIS